MNVAERVRLAANELSESTYHKVVTSHYDAAIPKLPINHQAITDKAIRAIRKKYGCGIGLATEIAGAYGRYLEKNWEKGE